MADLQFDKARLLWQLPFEGEWPSAIAFVGPRKLAAGNRAGQLYLWELPEIPAVPAEPPKDDKEADSAARKAAPPPTLRLDGHTNAISRLVASSDGNWLISASFDHSIRLWSAQGKPTGMAEVVLDAETRQREAKRTGKKAEEQPGIPVGTRAADHVFASHPPVADGQAGKAEMQVGHQDWVMSLGISGDGKRLISGDGSAQVIVWDLEQRKQLTRWSGHPWNWIVAAALSPDGKTALVSEFRYKRDDFDIPCAGLKLWNVEDGKEQLDLLKVQFPKLNPEDTSYGSAQPWRKFVCDGLIAADFSPDGKLVALGQGGETDTGKMHIIEVETGKLLRTIGGHQYGVTDLKFSQDGKLLFSTGRDTSLRVTQVEDGKEIAALGKPRGGQFKDWLSALAVSPDQQLLAATDIAGLVHVWTVPASS